MFILRGSPGGSRVLRFRNHHGLETAAPPPQCSSPGIGVSEVSSGWREGHREVRVDESQLREAPSVKADGGRVVEGHVRGGGMGCPHPVSG